MKSLRLSLSPCLLVSHCLLLFVLTMQATAADWHQWRGPNRNGVAPNSPKLIDALPAKGMKPLWICDAKLLPSARSGGWSSPIISGNNLYLYTHKRFRTSKGRLPKRKFPYLAPEKRKGMSPQQYAEYEKNRRTEDEQRAKNFRHDETVYCLDRNSGKEVWKHTNTTVYSRFSQSGSPAIADGRLVVLGAGRVAYCLNAKSGKKLWDRRLPGSFRDEYLPSSFVIANDRAIVLADDLFALDTATGKIIWTVKAKSKGRCFSSPTVWIHNKKAFVISNMAGGITVCVSAKDGKQMWSVRSQAGHSSPLVIGDKLITYGSSRKRGLRCYDLSPTGAKLAWTNRRLKDPGSSPVVLGNFVFVQGERRLSCVDLKSGKSRWTTLLDLNRPQYTSLIAADNKVFYACDNVLCFKASPTKFESLMNAKIDETGLMAGVKVFRELLKIDELETTAEGQRKAERIWRQKFGRNSPLPCSSPAFADGKIYIRLRSGIACYDLRR